MAQAVGHHKRGDLVQAESLYQDILRQAPELADAHNFLGMLAHQTGRNELADTHMRRSVELAPERAEFHHNYGNMLSALGRYDLAAREFQAATDAAPGMLDAWQGLGLAMRALGMPMHAIACFMQVLEKDRQRPELWLALGECFHELGMLKEAADAYRWGQHLAPADGRFQSALATIAVDSGDDTAAQTSLQQLLQARPTSAEAYYQYGVWRANKGEFDAARTALEKALELAPDYYQAALYYSYITPLAVDSPLVMRLTREAGKDDWKEPGQGANVHFTLGYVLDKAGQYDAAFSHYLEANALQRRLQPYSTLTQLKLQRSVLEAFGRPFLERSKRFGNPSAKPLFIVGMPRSGTSLLEQVLASHPAVHGCGEMTLLHAELRRRLGPAGEIDFAKAVLSLPDAELANVAAAMLAQVERLAPESRYVTDKLPSNAVILGLIHALFPQARIIHCRRDALDTCVSCFTTSFRHGHQFTNDLTELGEYHGLYTSAMTRWKELLPAGSILEVGYEDLISDMERQVRAILAFCDLPWDPACLHFQDKARNVATASVYQVRQPVYKTSIGRWRRYEAHLAPLQQALAAPPLL